jgi:hypothetical protein
VTGWAITDHNSRKNTGPAPPQQHIQPPGQPVQTHNVSSMSLDDMFSVTLVV